MLAIDIDISNLCNQRIKEKTISYILDTEKIKKEKDKKEVVFLQNRILRNKEYIKVSLNFFNDTNDVKFNNYINNFKMGLGINEK